MRSVKDTRVLSSKQPQESVYSSPHVATLGELIQKVLGHGLGSTVYWGNSATKVNAHWLIIVNYMSR